MKRILGSLLVAVAFAGSVLAFFPVAFPAATASAQTSGQFPELDKNGKPVLPRPNPYLIYSPADLGHNAVTLPANPTPTNNTAIIRASGVTKLTYFMNCTQITTLTMNVYTADDKVNPQLADFTLYGSYPVFTAIAAGAQQVYIATELAPNATNGSVGTVVRFPQIAVSFSELNAGATPGTCTDRIMAGYN